MREQDRNAVARFGDMFDKEIAQLGRTYFSLEKPVVDFEFGLKVKRGVGRGWANEVGELYL